MNRYSDEELLERYRESHDTELIGVLFGRYQHVVLGIALKYLQDRAAAEDAVMDVFESLINILQNTVVQNFPAWLGTVTRNQLHRKYRNDSRVRVELYEDDSSVLSSGDVELPDDGTLRREWEIAEIREGRLKEAIGHLNDQQQQCIRLFYLENQSYADICQSTGYTFKAVKSYIQNGRRNLKNILGGPMPGE